MKSYTRLIKFCPSVASHIFLFVFAAAVVAIPACGGSGSGVPPTPCELDPDSCSKPPPPPPTTIPLTAAILNPAFEPLRNNTALIVQFSRSVDELTLTGSVVVEPVSGEAVSGEAVPVEIDAGIFAGSSGTLAVFRPSGGSWPFLLEQSILVTVTQAIKAADDGRSLESEVSATFIVSTNGDSSIAVPTNIKIDNKAILSVTPIYTRNQTTPYEMALSEPILIRISGTGENPICNNESATIALTGFIASGMLEGLLFEPDTEVACVVTLHFTDFAGNTENVGFDLVFDQIPPSAPAVSPVGLLADNYTPDSTVQLDVTPATDPGASEIRVSGGAISTVQTISSPTESVTVSLSNGVNALNVFVVDRAGNEGEPTSVTVIRDNTPPLITNLSIQNQGTVPRTLTAGVIVTVNGSELDAESISFTVNMAIDERATIRVLDVTDPDSPEILVEDTRTSGTITPLVFQLNAGSAFSLRISAENVVGLTTQTAVFPIRTDTTISPGFDITDLFDDENAAYSGAPGLFRVRSIRPVIEGIAERGSILRFSALGLDYLAMASPDADFFPAQDDLQIKIGGNTTTNITLVLTDPAGNAASYNPAIAVTSDQTAPQPPAVSGVAADAECTSAVNVIDDAFVLIQIFGGIGTCGSIEIEGSVQEDSPVPTAGGATLVQSVLNESHYPITPLLVQENQPADSGPFSFSLPVSGLSPNEIAGGVIYAVDRVGNQSPDVPVIIATFNDASATVPAYLFKAYNNETGGRPGETLELTVIEGPGFITSPTNAEQIVVYGITTPGATVDIFLDSPPGSGGSLLAAASLPPVDVDAVTGEFQLTVRPDMVFPWGGDSDYEIQSFTIRTSLGVDDADLELQVLRDEEPPDSAPLDCEVGISPPFPSSGNFYSQISVPDSCLQAFQRTQLVVQNLGGGSPSCPAESLVETHSALLLPDDTTRVNVPAATGDIVQVFFMDEAGNRTPIPDWECLSVPSNRAALARTGTSESVIEPTFQVIDLDAPAPEFFAVTLAPEGASPLSDGSFFFYDTNRVFEFSLEDSSSFRLRNFSFVLLPVPTATLDENLVFDSFTGVSLHGRSDLNYLGVVAPGAANSTLKKIGTDGSTGQVTGATDILFPGATSSGNLFPFDIKLVPPVTGRPARALVLRFAFALSELAGDLLLFDLDSNASLFPAEPYVNTNNGSKRGYPTCKAPSQLDVAPDGYRAYVVCNTSNPSDTDITSVTLAPVTPFQSDAFSSNLIYDSGSLSGLQHIVALPEDGKVVVSSSDGSLYLVTGLETISPSIQASASREGHFYSYLALTADGTRLLAGNGVVVDVYAVGSNTLTWERTLESPVSGAPLDFLAPLP